MYDDGDTYSPSCHDWSCSCVCGGCFDTVFHARPLYQLLPSLHVYEKTGLQCPGCGSQRAFHSLLRGDFSAAWHYNALFVLELPLLVLLVAAWYLRSRIPVLHRVLNSRSVILTILAIIILWTIFRNIYNL